MLNCNSFNKRPINGARQRERERERERTEKAMSFYVCNLFLFNGMEVSGQRDNEEKEVKEIM